MGKKVGPNPTDRAKDGVKRSVLTEACAVPIGLVIDGANRHDSKLVEATVQSIPVRRPKATRKHPQGMCLDTGYDSDWVGDLVKEFGYTAHIRARGEEAQAIKREAGFQARRLVVERTHSWMNRSGASSRGGKGRPQIISACFIYLVCAVITYRCAG